VARRLAGPEYQPTSTNEPASLKLPLSRTWEFGRQTRSAADYFMTGNVQGPSSLLFFGDLTCCDAISGKRLWWHSPSGDWRWWQPYGDTAIVAGPRAVCHLRTKDGTRLWGIQLNDALPTDCLGQFQISGGQLFFLNAERRLFAVDVEIGQVLWVRWAPAAQIRPAPPAGRFQSWYYAGAERVLIQSSLGLPLLLDSLTGDELPCALRPGMWLRPPVAVNERQVWVVPDTRHVVLFDLVTGKEVWTHTIESAS